MKVNFTAMTLTNILKTVLAFLFSIFLLQTRAEYNGYQLSFTITTTEGVQIKGYNYIDEAHFEIDSARYSEYMVKLLSSPSFVYPADDSVHFYRNRIAYQYSYSNEGEKQITRRLLNKTSIAKKDVRSIILEGIVEQSSIIFIASPISLADTLWIKTEPQEFHLFNIYHHEFLILIHEPSALTQKIISDLKAEEDRYKRIIQEIEELKNNEDDTVSKHARSLEQNFVEEMDERFRLIILKLEDSKAVVVKNLDR